MLNTGSSPELRKFELFIDENHPDAFIDFEKLSPSLRFPKECPKCKGYGGWNLRVNEYKLPVGLINSPNNRHRYCHFRANCPNCFGWGYVKESQICVHEWGLKRTIGKCLSLYKCCHCGEEIQIDSSD